MGRLHWAQDPSLDRRVDLKVLHPDITAAPARQARFVREAKAASALNHPNIITVYQIGEGRDVPFIVTEFVEGETLRRRIARGPLPVTEARAILRQCATALQAAHGSGILHRDIKPAN